MIVNFYIENIYLFTTPLMSNQQNKVCKGCHTIKNYEEFLNEKGVALKKYLKCQNNIKIARSKNNKEQLDLINYLNIIEAIYNSLTSLNNTNKLYEGENEELNINLNIELSSLLDNILEKDDKENQNLDFEIGRCIITFISEGDGYMVIHGSIRIKIKKRILFF